MMVPASAFLAYQERTAAVRSGGWGNVEKTIAPGRYNRELLCESQS